MASADGTQCPQLTHGAVVYMQADYFPFKKKYQYLYQISKKTKLHMKLDHKWNFYETHKIEYKLAFQNMII